MNIMLTESKALTEAGRVLSAKNEQTIRSCCEGLKRCQEGLTQHHQTLLDLLGQLGQGAGTTPEEPEDATDQSCADCGTDACICESAAKPLITDVVPLVERAVRQDGSVLVKLIAPGPGASGYYPAEVLERDGPKVFCAGTKMYRNHPTAQQEAERPEGAIEDLAAVLVEDARWMPDGPKGAGLYAPAKVFSDHAQALDEKGPYIGVSIRAQGHARVGRTADGYEGPIIERIVGRRSVDFVTEAGAGGAVVLSEAAKSGQPLNPPSGKEGIMDEKEVQALKEAQAALESKVASLVEASKQDKTRIDALEQENDRLREASILREAAVQAASELRKADLPDAAAARVLKAVTAPKAVPVKDGALDRAALTQKVQEAVREELSYFQSLGIGTGRVQGMGGGGSTEPTPEQTEAALKEAFGGLGLDEHRSSIAARGRTLVSVFALLLGLLALMLGNASAETNRVYSPGYNLSVAVSSPSDPNSGDPVRYGKLTGVAQTDEDSDGYTSVDFGPGVWNLLVDDDAGSGIAVGDPIYFHDSGTGTPTTSLNNVATSADAFFGVALEVVSSNATSTIRVMHLPMGLTTTLASSSVTTGMVTNGTLLPADEANPGRDVIQICGDLTTINNNTVYYGPNRAVSATSASGMTCSTAAAGNTTEATADASAFESKAFQVLGMTCRTVDTNNTVSFTLRNNAGATVPSVTCSTADNELDCVADVQSTTAIAAGNPIAIAAASTGDIGTAAFVCNISVAY